jgi:hypothetical protein
MAMECSTFTMPRGAAKAATQNRRQCQPNRLSSDILALPETPKCDQIRSLNPSRFSHSGRSLP